MDYPTAAGTIVDASGRRQFADLEPGQQDGTDLCAAVFNPPTNEIVAAIDASGQTRSASNETQLTTAIRALSLQAPFDADFAKSIGGYPMFAIVADADPASLGVYWMSTAANNQTVPGAEGAAWVRFGWNQFVKQGWGFSNFGDNQIYIGLRKDGSGVGIGIDGTNYGTFALKKDVMPSQSVFGQNNQLIYIPTPDANATTTHITQLNFTAPYDGYVSAFAHFNTSNLQPSQCQGILQVLGSSYQPDSGATLWSDTTVSNMSGSGGMRVKQGDAINVLSSYNLPSSSSTFQRIGQTVFYNYMPSGIS